MPKWYHIVEQPKVHRVTNEDSIFLNFDKYGFMVNIMHPAIIEVYLKYKKEIGEATFPITNDQRFEFERRVITGYYPELKSYLERDRK